MITSSGVALDLISQIVNKFPGFELELMETVGTVFTMTTNESLNKLLQASMLVICVL